MKKHTVISGLLALFVAVGIFVSREFGDELKVMQHRSDVPEWGDEPFFADPDPQADAIVAATRYALLRRAAAIEAAKAPPPSDVAAAEAEAEAQPDAAPDAEVQAEDEAATEPEEEVTPEPALTDSLLEELHPPLAGIEYGDRWILTLYMTNPGKGRIYPAIAPLEDGLLSAADSLIGQLPTRLRTPAALNQASLKIDKIIDGSERTFPLDGGPRGVSLDEGIDGVVLRHPKEDTFYFLPSLATERKVGRSKIHGRARFYARQIGDWRRKHTKEAEFAAFRTRAWVEPVPGGVASGELVAVTRGNTDVPEVSPEILRERIALAADFLTRETNEDGMITYEYQASEDTEGDNSYNILRHAGTGYSMMQGYRLTGDPETLAAAIRAMGFYRRAMRESEKHPGAWYVLSVSRLRDDGRPRIGRRAKLGGIGLGLCMLVELEKGAPGTVDMDLVYGMAEMIENMQAPDGSFASFYDHDGREKSIRKSIYYSGEAILGLLRVHQLTGDEHWLDVAVKGADYLVHKRWRSLGIELFTPPDAWLVQGLEEMDRVRPDDARADYAFAIGDMIARHKLMDPLTAPPDLLGADLSGLGSLPNAATAGSFGEALSAVARLEARRRPDSTRYRTFAMYNARFQLRNQFWGPNSYYLPNPERSYGGFRVKPDAGEVRNDYVQHNLSGMFGLLDLLDETAPDIAWLVPAAQRPTIPEGRSR